MQTEPTVIPGRSGVLRAAGVQVGPSARVLRELWATRSLTSVWPGAAEQWQCGEVDAVCAGLVSGGIGSASGPHRTYRRRGTGTATINDAARSLGEQRAEVGAELGEARTDLAIALDLARVSRRRSSRVLDSLTVGWADGVAGTRRGDGTVDRSRDLPTPAYLDLRLQELYREASLADRSVADTHLIVAVETSLAPQRLLAEAHLTTLYCALRYAFVGGESIVGVTDRRVIVLARRDEPRLSDSLARLRSELRTALVEERLADVHSWRLALPHRLTDLAGVLVDLQF